MHGKARVTQVCMRKQILFQIATMSTKWGGMEDMVNASGKKKRLEHCRRNILADRRFSYIVMAVYNHWTGPVDWTGGLD